MYTSVHKCTCNKVCSKVRILLKIVQIRARFCLAIRPILSTNLHTAVFCILYSYVCYFFFFFLFWRAIVFWPLLCLCRPFCIFERCLDWIRTQRAAVASRRATDLGTHLLNQGDGYVCYLLIFQGRFLKAQNVP